MKLLSWLVSIFITGILISPFFLFKFLSKKKAIYLTISSVVSFAFFLWYFIDGCDTLLRYVAKIDADLYYFMDDAGFGPIIIYVLLTIVSPFIFVKSVRGRIGVKYFFISSALSVVIFYALLYSYAYFLFPLVGQAFLENI